MSHEHMLNKIRKIDENIRDAEDRIAYEQVNVGNWKREREALFRDLTPEEKGALLKETSSQPTPAAPAAPPETKTPEQ
jgi:hypothetical protein